MSTDKVEKNPEIIGFACLYCTFKASEMAGSLRLKYPEGIRLIQVPCSSRVDRHSSLRQSLRGLTAFLSQDVTLVIAIFIKGNYFTRRKIAALKEMLDAFNMKEKIRLFWVSAAEARRFVIKVSTMYNEIKERKNVRKKG